MSSNGQPLLAIPAADESVYDRRKLLTMGGILVDFATNAMAGAFSPLVLPIGNAFRGSCGPFGDAYAEGMMLYVYFVRFSISILWGFVFLDAALSRHPEHGGYHMYALALWPMGLALLGWAVSRKSVVLVVVASVLLGVGHGPSKYNGGVLLPSWWAFDDNVRYCQAILGFVRGFGVIFWIMFFGCVTNLVGQEKVHMTLYITAIVQFCLLFIAVAPIMSKGEFHKVPKATCVSSTSLNETSPAGQRKGSLLMDWQFYAVISISTSVSFSGLGVKQLLAVLYQEGVSLAYSTSAYYSAASFLLYWLLMTLSPLMATQKFLVPMYAGALALEGFLYGVSSIAVDAQSASILLYCRVLSGGLLAVMLINKTSLNVNVLGKDRLKRMKSLGAPLEVLGGAGGLAAWLLHVHSIESSGGKDSAVREQHSFNGFFRLGSAMMFCACLLAICLWCSDRKGR